MDEDTQCEHPSDALVWHKDKGLGCHACGQQPIGDPEVLDRWGAMQVSDDMTAPISHISQASEADKPMVLQIAALNDALDDEMKEWEKNQIHPVHLGIVTYFLNEQFFQLVEYLEKIVPNFDGLAFEKQWKENQLMKLMANRKVIVAEKSRQDITQGIIGPDGKPVV